MSALCRLCKAALFDCNVRLLCPTAVFSLLTFRLPDDAEFLDVMAVAIEVCDELDILLSNELRAHVQGFMSWEFDIFKLTALSAGSPLVTVALRVFSSNNLFTTCPILPVSRLGIHVYMCDWGVHVLLRCSLGTDSCLSVVCYLMLSIVSRQETTARFFYHLERKYQQIADVPYHNNQHGADVLHSVHVMLQTLPAFSPLEVRQQTRDGAPSTTCLNVLSTGVLGLGGSSSARCGSLRPYQCIPYQD